MPDYEIHGASFVFGTTDADTSSMALEGFSPRNVTYDVEPEVMSTAINGEGQVEAIAISLPAKRKISASVSGYISTSFNRLNVANGFTLLSRYFTVTKISEPRKKGEFIEVTVDGVSYVKITS